MEEVDLKDLFSFLLKKIVFVFIISFLFLIAGIVYTLALKTPMYKGETTLVLAKKDDNINNSLTQNDITMNQKLVATYSVVVKSRQVVKQVIEELNLSYPVESLQNKISVTSVNDTEVIKITVIDKDSKQAAKIANTIASVFKKEIVNIYNLENVTILDMAEPKNTPYNIKVAKTAIIGFGGGLCISLMILFIWYYFDNSIKSQEDVEKKLGIAVIGNIPQVGKRGK